MARELAQILTELNPLYDPQRSSYNTQITELDPQQDAEFKGLEFAKRDAFDQITNQANRRGLFYSGIPIAEEQKYTGAQFLPSVVNLKGRYTQRRWNLKDALEDLNRQQHERAYGIQDKEKAFDLEQQRLADDRARAGSGGGFSPGGGVGGIYNPQQAQAAPAPQETLRDRWQREANAGDWNAQVALNYAGIDGRYDGPVNSQDEFDRLRSMGIQGNYYVANQGGGGGGGGLYSQPKPPFPTTR